MKLSEREKELLSYGLLELLSNAVEAKKLLNGCASKSTIDNYMKEIQALNNRVCSE